MAWDDIKVDGSSTLPASEYNDLVTAVKTVTVATNEKVILDGTGSTYLIYNGTKVALYVNNVKKAEWG